MIKDLSPDLAPYKGIIFSLVSYASHAKLDRLIERLTPKMKTSQRFLLKMEIKRLAKPCNIILDFRPMFGECEEVQHNNLCHYLDEISKTLFLASVEQNQGQYSVFMYHELTQKAQQRYLQDKKNQPTASAADNCALNINVATPINLSNRHYFHDEPELYHPKCKVFSYDPLGMSRNGKEHIGISVNLVDLNQNNCVLTTSVSLSNDDSDELFLWFYDHHQTLGFNEEIILSYSIVKQQRANNGAALHYHLRLNNGANSEMRYLLATFLQRRFIANKPYRQKQIPPLVDSVMAKSHEQFLSARIREIPLMCAKYTTGWRPTIGLSSSANSALWDFFSANEDHAPISRLFNEPAIQQALEQGQSFDDYAYVLKHPYGSDTRFAIIWQQQLSDDNEALVFLKTQILTGDYRYIRLTINAVDAVADAYVPSAVASSTNAAIAFLNRPLCRPTESSLKVAPYLAVLADVTEINSVLAIPRLLQVKEQALHAIEPLNCASKFRLAPLVRKSPLQKIALDLHDVRREDRFDHRIEIAITRCGKTPCQIRGFTSNISAKGLMLCLRQPLTYKPGDDIKLTLQIELKDQTLVLHNQSYQILGGNELQLRVTINGSESKHQACQALRQLIYQNLDELQPSGATAKQPYGMSQALRNIYAKNHLSVPFFIHQDKRQWYINSIAVNEQTNFPSLALGDEPIQHMLLKLINQQKFRDYCLVKLNKVSRHQPYIVLYMLVLPHGSEQQQDRMFWLGDIEQLQQLGKLEQLFSKTRALGNPTVLRVQLTKPIGVVAKGFIDELRYLKKISPVKANELVSTIGQIVGIGEVTDHTQQVLALFDRYIAQVPKSSLARAS